MAVKYFKRILTYLHCMKCNKNYICYLDLHKHVSHKKWYKYYKYFLYRFTQKFYATLRSMGEKFLKRILTYSYCTKHNEINLVKNHVSDVGSHKKFLIYYRLCLETDGNIFSIMFYGLLLLC